MKTKKKFSLKFSPVFGPRLGEDQKKNRSSLKCSPVFGQKKNVFAHRFCAQTFCQSYKGGGGACHNFAYHSMLIILSWRPKGGANAPPNTLLVPIGWFTSADPICIQRSHSIRHSTHIQTSYQNTISVSSQKACSVQTHHTF